MNNELYQALTQHYYSLQSERNACKEHINVLEARYKAIDEQIVQVNDILCKHGNHIYEHFEEEQTIARSEKSESELINCESTKCDNCANHNYCDYEPQESEG